MRLLWTLKQCPLGATEPSQYVRADVRVVKQRWKGRQRQQQIVLNVARGVHLTNVEIRPGLMLQGFRRNPWRDGGAPKQPI